MLDNKIYDSILKRLDPRIKITAVFIFSILVAVCSRFIVLFPAIAVGLLAVLISGAPIKEVLKRLWPVNLMLVFLWFFLPFSFSGEPVFTIGPFSATVKGLLYSAMLTLKSNTMMLMLIALVVSTPVFTMGHAMQKMGMPDKLVHLFFFTYRYVHVIFAEYIRMMNTLKVRCFKPGTDIHTYKTFANMVGMLLVKSFDRAQRVHKAMLCRGFNGTLYSMSDFSFKKNDLIFLIFFAAVILILGILEWAAATC